jgi:hypothetical protein
MAGIKSNPDRIELRTLGSHDDDLEDSRPSQYSKKDDSDLQRTGKKPVLKARYQQLNSKHYINFQVEELWLYGNSWVFSTLGVGLTK